MERLRSPCCAAAASAEAAEAERSETEGLAAGPGVGCTGGGREGGVGVRARSLPQNRVGKRTHMKSWESGWWRAVDRAALALHEHLLAAAGGDPEEPRPRLPPADTAGVASSVGRCADGRPRRRQPQEAGWMDGRGRRAMRGGSDGAPRVRRVRAGGRGGRGEPEGCCRHGAVEQNPAAGPGLIRSIPKPEQSRGKALGRRADRLLRRQEQQKSAGERNDSLA